jgi:hypothetical protein
VEGTDLQHYGSIRIGHLDSPYRLDVLGSLMGDVILGVVG